MNELVEKVEKEIVEFLPFEAQMVEFKERYDDVVYDLDDMEQNKQARSDRLAVGKVISRLDAAHKELKAPLKKRTDLIDNRRKEIKDELLAVQLKIKSQISEHEAKIQAHAEMLQQKVDEIEKICITEESQDMGSCEIKVRIEQLNNIDVDDSYEHRKADATLAKVDALKKLESMLEVALKVEEERVELERLRKEKEDRERAEREQKIANDARIAAEQKAADEKERLEREKIEAEEKAKQDLIDAEKQRIAEVRKAEKEKKDAIEAERKAWEQKEMARVEAEEKAKQAEIAAQEKRESDKRHSKKINNEAMAGFISGGMSKENAMLAVTLIAKRKINHVAIKY